MSRLAKAATIVAAALTFAACAETTVEVDTGAGPDESTSSTTIPITGTAEELLAELATEMSGLSAQIPDDGDQTATLARIEGIWVVVRPEVESSNPELVGGIDTTVEMARTAVDRIRPADADKAFQLLSDLVPRFTGDG